VADDDNRTVQTVELKETQPLTVAAVRSTGSFEEINSVLMDLFRWVLSSGGKVASYPMALFPDRPEDLGSVEERFEVCIPIEDDVRIRDEQDVTIHKLPPVTVACCRHFGSLEEVDSTYNHILNWVGENGLTAQGPTREIYRTNPMETKEAERVTEVQIPVGKPGSRVH